MMVVELAPELEARLESAAKRQGVDAATLVRLTLEERLPPEPMKRVLWNGMTVEEWIAETDAWVDTHRHWPALPDSALQREDWYGDRG